MRKIIVILLTVLLMYAGERSKLETEIENLSGKARILKLIELGELIFDEDEEPAEQYAEEAINYGIETEDPLILMKARSLMGYILFFRGDNVFAGEQFRLSLEMAEKLDRKDFIYDNFKQLGGVFYYLSDHRTSLIFYLKALDFAELLEDKAKMADIHNDLGSIYDEIKDFEKAMEFFKKALEFYLTENDEIEVAKVYNNMAVTLNNQKIKDEALEKFSLALEIYKRHGREHNQAIILNNMASIHIDLKNFDTAVSHLQSARNIFTKVNDRFGLALNGHNHGRALYYRNDFAGAYGYFERSLKAASEMGVKFLMRDNYLYMSMADSARSRFRNAYRNHIKYVELNTEIFEEQKRREIYDLTAKYDLERKERQTFSLIRDNEIKRLQIEKQKQINNFFIILFILLVAISYMAYRSYVQKAKAEELIKEYSVEIENFNKRLIDEINKTKKELNESNDKLIRSEKENSRMDKLASLGTMVAGITHEIKNPAQVLKLSMDNIRLSLNDLSVFIYDLMKSCSSKNKNGGEVRKLVEKHKIKKVFSDLKSLITSNKKAVDLIDSIVNSTLKISRFDVETAENSINDIVGDVITVTKSSIKFKSGLNLELASDIPPVKCNYQEVSQMLINLLTNSRDAVSAKDYDHDGGGEGNITVSTGKCSKGVFLQVTDNGIGMDKDQLNKMFEPFYTTKTGDGGGHGLGLYILKKIADNYGAVVTVESTAGEGTDIRIVFKTNDKLEKDVENV